MSTIIPKPVEGHIVPGSSGPFIQVYTPWGWETRRLRAGVISETPYGPAIEKEPTPQPVPQKPKQIGDEHHHNIMSAISSLVQQNTTQMADALPSNRLWR